ERQSEPRALASGPPRSLTVAALPGVGLAPRPPFVFSSERQGRISLARGWGRMDNGAMNATPPKVDVSPCGPAVAGTRMGQGRTDFEELYQRHSREVWAWAYARWMNADTAMDITQEAFLRLWKKWEDGEAIHNPRAWLLRVARNLAEDHAKSAFRRNGTHPPPTMNGVQAPPRRRR